MVQAVQAGAAVRVVVDLKGALCRAVRIHQHYVHGALVGASRVVLVGADCQIGHAVAVQVARGRERYTEFVVVLQVGAAVRVVGDLGRVACRAVCVHQHDVHGAPAGAARVVLGGARRQVRHAVAVDVARGRGRCPEAASVGQLRAAVHVVGDLGRAACRAARVHQHDVHGAPAHVVPGGARHQVGHRVAIQVQGRHGCPKIIGVGQPRAAVQVVGDLGRAACRAVCAHQHDVYGAPVGVGAGAARVVLGGAHRQVGHRVAVEVQGRHGSPKVVSVCQRGAVCYAAVDLHGALYSAVAVHQHEVHGARL